MRFSPDGQILASGGYDKTIRLWDVATRKELARLEMRETGAPLVAFSPDGKWIASSRDGKICLWDVATRTQVALLEGPARGAVSAVAFSPDGQFLASGRHDGTVRLWDVHTHEQVALLRHVGKSRCLTFSPDGRLLASGGGDGTLLFWNVQTLFPVRKSSIPNPFGPPTTRPGSYLSTAPLGRG